MSTYKKITKHPQSKQYEIATWHDDYYGHHIYGVEFPSDGKVYPTDIVDYTQIYDFWAEDVIAAFRRYLHLYHAPVSEEDIIKLLNLVQKEYTERWKRDPITGEGATKNSKLVKKLTD